MSEAVLKYEPRRALKIGVGLRATSLLLQILQERDLLPDGELVGECLKRRVQLDWLAEQFETAAKEATPELPKHERPESNRKLVWCANPDCDRALTREQARADERCPVCRQQSTAAT